jgi:hypothetical protein
MRNHINATLLLPATLSASSLVQPADTAAAIPGPKDRHYNKIGFFDMHACNWPGRPVPGE